MVAPAGGGDAEDRGRLRDRDARMLLEERHQRQHPREPLLVPAARWMLGATPGGFVFDVATGRLNEVTS